MQITIVTKILPVTKLYSMKPGLISPGDIQFQCVSGEKKKNQMKVKNRFFEGTNKVTEICQHYLEEEFGPDMASYLTNSLYWKQVEYTDKKGKTKKKKD